MGRRSRRVDYGQLVSAWCSIGSVAITSRVATRVPLAAILAMFKDPRDV